MNLLLIEPQSMVDADTAFIRGRQLQHMREILRVTEAQTIQAGVVNGPMGHATITKLSDDEAILKCVFDQSPPSPLPVKLVIALPRPKMMRRIVQTVATMGVKDIYFINAYKVEKSFWSTPWLNDSHMHENLMLGLEQAKDTVMPKVYLKKLFKPFVEDELSEISSNTTKIIAHPGSPSPCPTNLAEPTTVVIGPEGGFTDYEVNKIRDLGFTPIHMGSRIFRVETAIPALLAKMFSFSL